MSFNYSDHLKSPTQGTPIPGKSKRMTQNSCGAYVFKLDKWGQLNRFLILGSTGGTYYVSENKLTLENIESILECIQEDGKRAIDAAVTISDEGRAFKNDQAVFVLGLAIIYGDQDTKNYAYLNINKICRIGTHLFQLLKTIRSQRKFGGTGMKKAFTRYYSEKPVSKLALDLLKYQSREGWSHKDVMRLIKWAPEGDQQKVLKYYMKGELEGEAPTKIIEGVEKLKKSDSKKAQIDVIKEYGLPRELCPTELFKEKMFWRAQLPNSPYKALLRNLSTMSQSHIDLFSPFSDETKVACNILEDEVKIQSARIHPLDILLAMWVYRKGASVKGSTRWVPSNKILESLENAFYKSFKYSEPMSVNVLIALDVSGSMDWELPGTTFTASEASAAITTCLLKTEENVMVTGFSERFCRFDFNKNHSLGEVIRTISSLPFGSTNCALPMQHALKCKWPVDLFLVVTDNETNSHSSIQVDAALAQFRDKVNPKAKLAVCATEATKFTIGDPNDAGILNISGFDASLPKLLSEFVKGF